MIFFLTLPLRDNLFGQRLPNVNDQVQDFRMGLQSQSSSSRCFFWRDSCLMIVTTGACYDSRALFHVKADNEP